MEMMGTLLGVFASTISVVLWLVTFHKRFFISLHKTQKHNAYGVYADFGEACRTHLWYLIKDLIPGRNKPTESDRELLERQVQQTFHQHFGEQQDGNILIAHSCRSIFYYVIHFFLNNAERNTLSDGQKTIRICLPSLHFGSFYRMLRGIEKSMNVRVEFYEVDFNEKDWTLDQDSVDEDELQKCDLLLVQHIFGLPLNQDRLVKLAKKHDIPILEDCVQSGSLFGKYRGYSESDIIMYSGGLDKTPPCFGGGFGFFRNTRWGNQIYEQCKAFHTNLPVDTWQGRFMTCFNVMLHVMIAKNSFGCNNLLGLVSYVWLTERGEYINWFALSLKVRQAKVITPFQHSESGFLRKPSTYQLQSMLYGLSKKKKLNEMAKHEYQGRELLLSTIPAQYHKALFPWLTKDTLATYKEMQGVSEFSWVVSPIGDRLHLCQFLNDQFLVLLINTTWEADEKSKATVGKYINDNLVYLPNINEMNQMEIVNVGKALTRYCEHLQQKGEYTF